MVYFNFNGRERYEKKSNISLALSLPPACALYVPVHVCAMPFLLIFNNIIFGWVLIDRWLMRFNSNIFFPVPGTRTHTTTAKHKNCFMTVDKFRRAREALVRRKFLRRAFFGVRLHCFLFSRILSYIPCYNFRCAHHFWKIGNDRPVAMATQNIYICSKNANNNNNIGSYFTCLPRNAHLLLYIYLFLLYRYRA